MGERLLYVFFPHFWPLTFSLVLVIESPGASLFIARENLQPLLSTTVYREDLSSHYYNNRKSCVIIMTVQFRGYVLPVKGSCFQPIIVC